MFIDRKINGALIQDLALRKGSGEVCACGGVQVWRPVEEPQKEEALEKEQQRKERIRQMRISKEEKKGGGGWWWDEARAPVATAEGGLTILFSLAVSQNCSWVGMNKPQMEPEKGGEKKEEKEERRTEGRAKINFSQTEAGWSNGGRKKEEEEEKRTYFPLITSCSLIGKPWKLALVQPAVSLVWPFCRRYTASLPRSSAPIWLLGGERQKSNVQNDEKNRSGTSDVFINTSVHFYSQQ